MEFLGVGPAELVFILIIALIVVGPERLPVLARQAGKFLVTVRDWVQKSPDAAMILRAPRRDRGRTCEPTFKLGRSTRRAR